MPKKECPLCKQVFQRINLNRPALDLISMSKFLYKILIYFDIKIKHLKNLTKLLEEVFNYISLYIDDEID